jgi:glucose-specific phosphotransferase system IIA component
MGFLDKLFGKSTPAATPAKPAPVTVDAVPQAVFAPANGTGVAMKDIPDPVFSAGAMGVAFGVKPSDGVIYAPVTGTITATTPTLHAVGLTSADGIEVLIHVGVDTVEMKGDGFTGFVERGQSVVAGEALMKVDLAKIAAAGHPDVVITVITNSDEYASIEPAEPTALSAGDKIFTVNPKA